MEGWKKLTRCGRFSGADRVFHFEPKLRQTKKALADFLKKPALFSQ
ncbi:hypothetical protein HHL25_01510 [Rhizobium sp. S-51]|uniref:Uncharacterized protein n=1 Tax=Rhizobium terricola TaxID=2728849 RepID=A0A7Y0FTY2_9HYPH|nr:hypothetical protein [Rhizobium terricola]